MNLQTPLSSLMTTDLMVVNTDDKILVVKNIMENHELHHVPVVKFNKLVGLISKTDLVFFLKEIRDDMYQEVIHEEQLKKRTAKDIMTENLECLRANDTLQMALNIFHKNKFHAIPIVDDDDGILGIVTTFDILNKLSVTDSHAS